MRESERAKSVTTAMMNFLLTLLRSSTLKTIRHSRVIRQKKAI